MRLRRLSRSTPDAVGIVARTIDADRTLLHNQRDTSPSPFRLSATPRRRIFTRAAGLGSRPEAQDRILIRKIRCHTHIMDAYANGANTYVPKPSSFDELGRHRAAAVRILV
jgi:hypothetical protein